MEFKFDKDNATGQVAAVVTATAGGLGSRVAAAQIIGDDEKKSKLVKGGLAAVGLAGAVMIKGSDLAANALRGLAAGIAVVQGIDLAKELLKPEDEGASKTLKQAFGLKGTCPTCYSTLRSAYFNNYTTDYAPPALSYTPEAEYIPEGYGNPLLKTINKDYN